MKKLLACIVIVVFAGLMLTACEKQDTLVSEPDDTQQAQEKVYPDDYVVPLPEAGVAREQAPSKGGPPMSVTICHKFGTPAQKTMTLPWTGARGHVQGHGDFIGGCGGRIIDADGTVSAGRGLPAFIDAGLVVGASLTSWPTGFWVEGLDWFDNDGSCTWTLGDDLHVEDPATHPGANRNALHDANPVYFDPVVLDLDGSFFDGQPVDVDLETGSTFTGCPGVDPRLTFFDVSGNGFWDDGEDIVMDVNGNGIFD